jgi:hypothetical protein
VTTVGRLTLRWVALYTRGLPDEVAARRREELASDLHEHTAAGGRPAAVLGRVLWGIPADLSWRRAARAPRTRRLETGAPVTMHKVTVVLFAVYALFMAFNGLGIIANGYLPWGLPLVVAGGLVAVGLWQRADTPRRSTLLLGAGALVPAVTLYWMAIILLPIAAVLIWLAVASEPGRRSPAPAV